MTTFVCKDCGYRFKSEKAGKKRCPYCGKGNAEKEKTAKELVDSVKAD